MVYGPRAGLGTWLTFAVTAAALCVPLFLFVAVPSLSQPAAPLIATRGIPTASGVPGRLDSQLASLPIVVADFPDAPSQAAASEYSSLRVQQPAAIQTMFSDTWHSLSVDASNVDAVNQLRDYLISVVSDLDAGLQVHAKAAAALSGLESDPRNADRLSNAAVALFDMGVSWDQGFVARQGSLDEFRLGTLREARAVALLHELAIAFPADRAVALNLAYLTSVIPSGCAASTGGLRSALAATASFQLAPDDAVGRLLVASLQARDSVLLADALVPGQNDQPAALTDALATVDALTKSNSTAGLGQAAKGDAYLAAAIALAGQAPYQARHYAQLARLDYEDALVGVNDPGLWAGEAASLNILGNTSGALASQRIAVSLAPGSAELILSLALYQERAGDFRGMRSAAQQALALSLTAINPLFREARLMASTLPASPGSPVPGDRGYLGYSFGSDRTRLPVYNFEGGCGGGGFTTTEVVPAEDNPGLDESPHYLALPDAAVLTAIAASLVFSDPSAAEADVIRWMQVPGSSTAAAADGLWMDRVQQVAEIALQAVHLVADGSMRPGTDPIAAARFAESNLRHSANAAGQASLYARAAAICHMRAHGQGPFSALSAADRSPGFECEGESAYHAGDYASASAALAAFDPRNESSDVGTKTAIATWKAGRPEAARRLLLKVLAGQDPKDPTYLGTNEILGELLLDQGDPNAAIDHFDLVLNDIQSFLQPGDGVIDPTTAAIRLIVEHAYNNHGVALLWRAQHAPGAAPDCGGADNVCQQARDDFAAALNMDPNNPYYLQNAAWSDRLLNHFSAARVELAGAAAADPSDFPVLNDLGVMAAMNGDLPGAEQAFKSSLRARPGYDLAAWNLGVVGMQMGSFHVAAAQAYLARAARENPQLRGSPLQYQVDNRIYRAAFGQPLQPSQSAATVQGYSHAAVATGGIAAFSALDDAMGIEVKAKLGELLRQLRLAGFVGGARLWLAQMPLRLPRRLPAPVRTWWLTLLVLAGGTAWTVSSRQGVAGGAELALAVLATGIAVLVHECGHLVAACVSRIRIAPAPSPLGIVMSVLLIPLHINSGPYSGHRSFPGTPLRRARWVYLAGPVANLLVAGLAYGLYRAQPAPFLLLLTGVQLAAAGFSLMPFEPLDGAALSKSRERSAGFSLLAVGLSLVIGLGGLSIASGRL